MRIFLLSGAAGLLTLAATAPGEAACQCACVDGQVQAICENALDMKPICAPKICQIVPPAVRPIQAPTIPPLGTSSCGPQQVFDPQAGRYVWQTLCR